MTSPGHSSDESKLSSFQRFARVLGFAASFARARRREFDILWRQPGRHGPKAVEFARRVDSLLKAVEKGEAFLGLAKGQSPLQALATLQSFDLDQLGAATRGLEKLARELKADPGLQAAVTVCLTASVESKDVAVKRTGELDFGKETRRIMGMVKGWLTPGAPILAATAVVERGAAIATRAVSPLEQQQQAFNAALELVRSIVDKVGPRLRVVDVSLEATGLPSRRRAWEEVEEVTVEVGNDAGLQPSQLGWALMLAELFMRETRAVQVAHNAVTQWRQAGLVLGEAQALKERLNTVGENARQGLLSSFHVGKFKATAFPLSHLHLTFRGLSPLQELFPPPSA